MLNQRRLLGGRSEKNHLMAVLTIRLAEGELVTHPASGRPISSLSCVNTLHFNMGVLMVLAQVTQASPVSGGNT